LSITRLVLIKIESIGRSYYLHVAMVRIQLRMLWNYQKSLGDYLARKPFFNDAESFHFIPKSLTFLQAFTLHRGSCIHLIATM